MTRFTDPEIYQCPDCLGYLQWRQLASFRNFTSTTWSDGARPMTLLLDMCSIACCPSCSTVLWYEDLQAVGVLPREPGEISRFSRMLARWSRGTRRRLLAEREWANLPPEWKSAECGRPLEYSDLQRTVDRLTGTNPVREMFLRRRIWWATNDHLRGPGDGTCAEEAPIAPELERRENMMRMIALHEAAGGGLAERAELLRQLGRFDESIQLLISGAPEIRNSATAAWTLRWAKARDAGLKKFA